jgi:hypothetical protein
MKVFITQSNYIPWKGYFDAINQADVFVMYDDMQYTKNDWRNRNQIKTPAGAQWLTIPVKKVALDQKICETEVADQQWRKKHWKTIVQNYSKSTHFDDVAPAFEELYLQDDEVMLSKVNAQFIRVINKQLGISTEIRSSAEFDLNAERTQKLVNICSELNADTYLSGPAAKNYLNESLFQKAGIEVEWLDYSGYPEYPQLFGDFIQGVTVLDLLFNTGSAAPSFMKSFS